MPLDLHRIDDRLIHGQVVVGWGQPLELRVIVLVDDEVAGSEWEQDLYRMGVPPDMTVVFCTVADAVAQHATFVADARHAMLLTGDIDTMARLCAELPAIRRVNLGGIHHKPGRHQRLRYVFLADDEEQALRALAGRGVEITAQDLPSARPVPLAELLAGATSA
ncbi:MAG: PTS sugar transporter subunit IIB [Gemmatimonadaceae bacterium]|jgi:PTS system mannose-specific IIB component/fructoselysine and glucoselysine-specific PTS system IIB component|nr:PTS sugar transporter subunit IIB [Gemmatimonadaceae bacterium]